MILDRSTILSASVTLPREAVPIPEWGGEVLVRTLTASERDDLELKWESTKRKHFRARLAQATLCNTSGERMFGEGDIVWLGAQPTGVIQRIFDAASRLNKFTREEVEGLEKNSESDPSTDS